MIGGKPEQTALHSYRQHGQYRRGILSAARCDLPPGRRIVAFGSLADHEDRRLFLFEPDRRLQHLLGSFASRSERSRFSVSGSFLGPGWSGGCPDG